MGYFSSPHLVGCISPTLFRGVTPARWLCLEQLRLFFCFRLDEEVFLQPMWGVSHSNSASQETRAYSQWAKTAYKDPSHLNSLPLSLSHTNTFILSSDVCLLQGGFWSDFLQTWGQIGLEWSKKINKMYISHLLAYNIFFVFFCTMFDRLGYRIVLLLLVN